MLDRPGSAWHRPVPESLDFRARGLKENCSFLFWEGQVQEGPRERKSRETGERGVTLSGFCSNERLMGLGTRRSGIEGGDSPATRKE